ncbi:protein kinase PINOID [Malania oleifera]|uniref:protein kinase PINOID n=1 Tax=Malania oleifera TaxID=397392 RepID=UPI0025AE7FC3|nr:protein kinase PINOID [Malania oleifera]XP_057949942.1 protein kinase PINOID [Malania oleifera]XP_057949944.1 protein kinase PINOID [Malania oleifera]
MLEHLRDSGGERISREILNSSQSSSMSSESSFSRLSFDATVELSPSTHLPENLAPKPHQASDSAYEAIRSASVCRKTGLGFRDFELVRQIGSGDIGKVYLCRLRSSGEESRVYAMKVVDKEALALKKKSHRAEMEKKILKMVDHPFLPSLYAHFEDSHFSCIVMEFCSGGDLHNLRHKLPQKRFSLSSARFYAAEVLVALEYLHMLGIIYRDLKPENVLVRSDGHIMLSDFDLSLCSSAIPAIEGPDTSPNTLTHAAPRSTRPHAIPLSCLSNRLFRSRKVQTSSSSRLFVAEPVAARSFSFVGTHEYVAPEVASGRPHGNAVDWWAFGIFIYEMIYGRTPFSGVSNEATLRNIVKMPLTFPNAMQAQACEGEHHARSLLTRLLDKDPNTRLGSKRGAAEVKTHPFFVGLNFALVRSLAPPEIPGLRRLRTTSSYRGRSSTSRRRSTAFDYF